MKVNAYLCKKYRGENQDDATDEEIEENVRSALAVSAKIRGAFPETLELYIPHDRQDITRRLWQKGFVDSKNIIEVCCDIINEMDLLLVCGTISAGMLEEIAYATGAGIKVIEFDVFDDVVREKVAAAIIELRQKGERL